MSRRPTSTLTRALGEFRRRGLLQLPNVFDVDFVRELQTAHADAKRHPKSRMKSVGPLRFMMGWELFGPWLDERLLLNPRVLKLVHAVLGDDCVLDSFTSVTALPQAGAQAVHKDVPPLFAGGVGLDLPCHALTVVVPLCDLTPKTGTTALYPGSHHRPLTLKPRGTPVRPYLKLGGCFVMDYRITHFGTPNVGPTERPVLYAVFTRPWFLDSGNFMHVPPLRLSPSVESLTPQMGQLLRRHLIARSYT